MVYDIPCLLVIFVLILRPRHGTWEMVGFFWGSYFSVAISYPMLGTSR